MGEAVAAATSKFEFGYVCWREALASESARRELGNISRNDSASGCLTGHPCWRCFGAVDSSLNLIGASR
jgi:hypothetical protein